jgi:hypothetical protein
MPLVALDKSWAICLPKKTGSQSLVGMCEGVADVVGEYHGCEWDGEGERLMVVREPKERLASMYWWSRKEVNFNCGPGGPDEWLERFADLLGKPDEWTISQREMAERFKPHKVFRLEDGLRAVLDHLGIKAELQHRNRTQDAKSQRKSFAETFTRIPWRVRQFLDSDGGWH